MKFTHANRTWQQRLRRNIATAAMMTAALAAGYGITTGLIAGKHEIERVMQMPSIGPSTYAQSVGPRDRYLPIAPGPAALVTPGATITATIRKGN